ncbi:Sec-independent protein translocase protein TatB [Rhodococcus aerolatus]
MFGNIGWGEMAVLLVAGLFILGPERLPGAAAWLANALKQVREYATGARDQLRDELGPELDELRKPLSDLQQLRGLTPRGIITKHLFDGSDPIADLGLSGRPGLSGAPANPAAPVAGDGVSLDKGAAAKPTLNPETAPPPLAAGERPPFDADAT